MIDGDRLFDLLLPTVALVSSPDGMAIAHGLRSGGELPAAIDILLQQAVEAKQVIPSALFREVESVLTDPAEPEMDREFFAKTLGRYRESIGL